MNSVLHVLCREIVRLAGSIISVRQAVGHIAMLFTVKRIMLYLTEKSGINTFVMSYAVLEKIK